MAARCGKSYTMLWERHVKIAKSHSLLRSLDEPYDGQEHLSLANAASSPRIEELV